MSAPLFSVPGDPAPRLPIPGEFRIRKTRWRSRGATGVFPRGLPRGLILAGLVVALPRPAAAQEPGSLTALLASRPAIDRAVTIDQAVAIALRESPALRAAAQEVEAAEAQAAAARALRRPQVSASAFVSGGSNGNLVASPGGAMLMALPRGAFFDQNIALMAPLDLAGQQAARVRQAALDRAAIQSERETRRQEVALQVRTAFRETLARRALAQVERARLAESEERLRLDRARLAAESVPAFYIPRGEAEVAAARQGLADAERDEGIALAQLKTAMGIHPASALALALAPSDEDDDAFPEELPALLALAETRRPELEAARRRTEGAAAALDAVRRSYRPQAGIFAMGDFMRGRDQRGFIGATVGISLSVPLATGGQADAERRAREAAREKERIDAQRIALQIAQEIETARQELQAARKNVEATRTAQAAARESSRIARLRYEAGRSLLAETLDAQTAQVRAETAAVTATLEAGKARDRLRRAVGWELAKKSFDNH